MPLLLKEVEVSVLIELGTQLKLFVWDLRFNVPVIPVRAEIPLWFSGCYTGYVTVGMFDHWMIQLKHLSSASSIKIVS